MDKVELVKEFVGERLAVPTDKIKGIPATHPGIDVYSHDFGEAAAPPITPGRQTLTTIQV